jgi:hypothetical protein
MRSRAGLHSAIFVAFVLAYVSVSHALAAGEGTEASPYEVPLIHSGARIDGVLDDEAWSEALVLELGYETAPGENTEPVARTEFFIFTSTTHLYGAFRAEDPIPSSVCANITDRDRMYDDDRVSMILDTFNDQRRGYMFFCNPLGIQGDALDAYGRGAGDPAWDTIWESEGRVTDTGYVVEMAIPFSSLRFQRADGKQVWGIGLGRKYSRDFDYRMSHTPSDRDEVCYLCQVAKFRGFEGATPGRNIELDPTVSGFATQVRDDFPDGELGDAEGEVEPGLTARWGVTPNLVLSGAVNPDFSQVEADAFQLDVNTRFALYYEEKRPFFLEGMEHFNTPLNAVYTRTVADPMWGAKLTGKEGSNALGAFIVEDEVTNLTLPGSQGSRSVQLDERATGSVLRYRMDLASDSNIGLLLTNREGGDYHNRVGGVDGLLRLTPLSAVGFQVLGSRTQYEQAFSDSFDQPSGEFDGLAWDALYEYDSESLEFWLGYREIDDGFRSDMGYRPQADFRQARGGWNYVKRTEAGSWYTNLSGGLGYVHNEERDGDLLSRFFDGWLGYSGPLRSNIDVYWTAGKSRYGENEWDDSDVSVHAGFWPTGSTYLALSSSFGDAFDYGEEREADGLNLEPRVSFKLGQRLDVTLVHEYERLEIDEGRLYTANVSYARAAYQFTRRTFLRAILQYVDYDFNAELYSDGRDLYRQFASQLLFSYKMNPQTVLYLGYSDNYLGDEETDITQSDRTFFAKIGYAWVL